MELTVYVRRLTAACLLVGLCCATGARLAAAIECYDVRTGRTFPVPTAKYSAAGERIADDPSVSRLCVGSTRATHAVPARDGAGGAFVVWIEATGLDCDLRVQRINAAGMPSIGWPEAGRVLCSERGTQTQPAVAPGNDGYLWAAWRDYRDSTHSAIYLMLLGGTGEPEQGMPSGGLEVSGPVTQASDPQLASDGMGGVWLAWQQGGVRSHGIWLKRFTASGVLAAGWPSEGRRMTSASADAVHPVLTADSTGALALAWVELGGADNSLKLLRLDADGAVSTSWQASGGGVAASRGHLIPTALVPTPSGTVIAWTESFEDSSAVRVLSVENAGTIASGWPAGGRVMSSTGNASQPAMCSDGAGGAYVSWIGGAESGAAVAVQLLRVSNSGIASSGWPEAGLGVVSSATGLFRPRLLPTSDGVVVSWGESDERGVGTILSAASASLGLLPALEQLEKWPDLVRLTWRTGDQPTYRTLVEREEPAGGWIPIREIGPDNDGKLVMEDREVAAGDVVKYRLRLSSSQHDFVTGEIVVEVPALAKLAIAGLFVRAGRLHLAGSVPSRATSRFELFDVQGRRLLRDVRAHEHAGDIALDWPMPEGIRGGVFFARLTQGRETKTRRFVIGR